MHWLHTLRLTLLISLSILVVVMLWRRLKRKVIAHDLPAPSHAELIGLRVAYHPERLRVEVSMPAKEELRPSMLNMAYEELHTWPALNMGKGTHVFELVLNGHADGEYYFQLATSSQLTVRKFKVKRS